MRHYRLTAAISLLLILVSFTTESLANDPTLLPMYGGIAKTEQQKKLDADFIASVTKISGTHENASAEFIKKGFAALSSGDADTAMRRFNQAYLLTPKSDDVHWGLAAASAARGQFDDAFKLFTDLIKSQPENARLLNDYAFARINKALSIPQKDIAFEQLSMAEELLHKAQKSDANFDQTYFNLATIAYYQGNYQEAWKNVVLCERLGGKSLNPKFVQALNKALPRPIDNK